jgi:hypothetical protein
MDHRVKPGGDEKSQALLVEMPLSIMSLEGIAVAAK